MNLNALVNRLRKNQRHWSKWACRRDISCYRLYDRDIPEFPLAIDWYEGHLHVQIFARRGMEPFGEQQTHEITSALCKLFAIPDTHLAIKTRQRQRGWHQYEKTGHLGKPLVVNEGGLRFEINLHRYLDTGLFLDHRTTRDWVKTHSRDKSILNLYAYTGSFSVYAAAGGAERTVSVDLSNTYQDWTRRNLLLNRFDLNQHKLIREDVFQYLEHTHSSPRQFDLIVLDPPSFSNSKNMQKTLDIQRDHPHLIEACLKQLKKEGVLIFSTNRRSFKLSPWLAKTACHEEITQQVVPEDFRRHLPYRCWLFSSTDQLFNG
jgi:23S rRNA (cytosine1962-C5)-methyltransferase